MIAETFTVDAGLVWLLVVVLLLLLIVYVIRRI